MAGPGRRCQCATPLNLPPRFSIGSDTAKPCETGVIRDEALELFRSLCSFVEGLEADSSEALKVVLDEASVHLRQLRSRIAKVVLSEKDSVAASNQQTSSSDESNRTLKLFSKASSSKAKENPSRRIFSGQVDSSQQKNSSGEVDENGSDPPEDFRLVISRADLSVDSQEASSQPLDSGSSKGPTVLDASGNTNDSAEPVYPTNIKESIAEEATLLATDLSDGDTESTVQFGNAPAPSTESHQTSDSESDLVVNHSAAVAEVDSSPSHPDSPRPLSDTPTSPLKSETESDCHSVIKVRSDLFGVNHTPGTATDQSAQSTSKEVSGHGILSSQARPVPILVLPVSQQSPVVLIERVELPPASVKQISPISNDRLKISAEPVPAQRPVDPDIDGKVSQDGEFSELKDKPGGSESETRASLAPAAPEKLLDNHETPSVSENSLTLSHQGSKDKTSDSGIGGSKRKLVRNKEKEKERRKNLQDRRDLLASSSDESSFSPEIDIPVKKKSKKGSLNFISVGQLQKEIDQGKRTLPDCLVTLRRLTATSVAKYSQLSNLTVKSEENDSDFDRMLSRLTKFSPRQRLERKLGSKRIRPKRIIMSDDSDVVALSSDEEVAPPKQNGDSKVADENQEEIFDQNMADRVALLMSSDDGSNNDDDEEAIDEDVKKVRKESSKPKKKQSASLSASESDKEHKKSKDKEVEKLLKDSDSDFADPKKKKKKKKEESDPEAQLYSDESEELVRKKRKKRSPKESSSEPGSDESEKEEKKKRKRLKRIKADEDSDDSDDDLAEKKDAKGRKNIKKIIKDKHLQDETRHAAKEEEERRFRIAERQNLYNLVFEGPEAESNKKVTKVVLDFDPETKKELVAVHPKLCESLKPHQASGIKFMWDACYETVEFAKKREGSGCILAHCMGLGKTLQVVTLVHTLLTHEECNTRTALVVCPLSTVLNWVNEFSMWLKDELELEVYELASAKQNTMRKIKLDAWFRTGGVMIMGYDAYRLYTNDVNKKIKGAYKQTFQKTLVDPGPDIVICDEGHILKNENSALSKAMMKINTKRRVVLTGTPLQNNLKEYHCMINFVKPNLLGTKKEFLNRFVNPIMNGQCADATERDVKIMKRRAHVLHSMMEGSVQRKDYNVLTPFLPPKQEYVLSVSLSDQQIKMYRYYLDNLSKGGVGRGRGLFADFQALARLWTHPLAMKIAKQRQDLRKEQEDSEDEMADFIDDEEESDDDIQCLDDDKLAASGINWRTRTRGARNGAAEEDEPEVTEKEEKHWWAEFVSEDEMANIELSGKLVLLRAILRECEMIGDKILVFSQSLITLDVIEEFLKIEDEKYELASKDGSYFGSWKLGYDYFRLDGSMAADQRKTFCNRFNREDSHRARLFLISTKAGGLGINLVGANRVVIFDASWNPSYDIQSIFRVYRFGQRKPCYVYRFLAQGTMEEKIYQRQVAKQSLACRVVDEQQIERHFSMSDLQELYMFDPEMSKERPIPKLPKDRLLAELLQSHKELIVSYHEHDSLLESKEEENLNEAERKAAWEEYENEKKGLVSQQMPAHFDPYAAYGYQLPMNMNPIMPSYETLREYLKAQKPDMSNEELDARAKIALTEYVSLYRAMVQQQAIAERERMLALQQMMSLGSSFSRPSGGARASSAHEAGPSGARTTVRLPAKASNSGPTRLTEVAVPSSKVLGTRPNLLKGLLSVPKLPSGVTLTPVSVNLTDDDEDAEQPAKKSANGVDKGKA